MSDWLLIQTLRADANAKKKHTAISITDTVTVADACWDVHLAACHLGDSAASGHYVLLVRSGHDWLLYDDDTCHVASAQEISDLPPSWTFVLYHRRSVEPSPALIESVASTTPLAPVVAPSPVARPAVEPCEVDNQAFPSRMIPAESGVGSCGALNADFFGLFQALSQRVEALEVEVQRLRAVDALHSGNGKGASVSAAKPGCVNCLHVGLPPDGACLQSENRPENSVSNSVGCLADTSVVAAVPSCGGPQAQSFPCGPPPPVVVEPVPSEALPKRKGKAAEKQGKNALSPQVGSFPRSPNPAIAAEVQRLHSAGLADVAWLFERLHSDAILLPLAHQAQDVGRWKLLAEALAYNNREIQSQIQNESIHSQSVRWLVFRMLQRGRYTRFAAVLAAGQWDLLRQSLAVCEVPEWWTPPWCRPVNHPHAAQVRGRPPLLPHEWHRAQSLKRRRLSAQVAPSLPGAARLRSRSPRRSKASCSEASALPVVQPAVADAPGTFVVIPNHSVKNKKRRKGKSQVDAKGGGTGDGPSLFRVTAMNVTSLFPRVAAACALVFGLA